MPYLIPLTILVLSIAGMAYLVLRKARILSEKPDLDLVYPDFEGQAKAAEQDLPLSYLQKIFNIKEGGSFFIFTEKLFRKIRVRLMKMENWLTEVSKILHEKGLQRRSSSRRTAKSDDGPGKKPENGERASFVSLNDANGEFDERYWLDILKKDPESVYPYKKLGDIYMAREDFREARWALKRAIKLDPSNGEAKSKIEELRGKRTRRSIKSS